MADVTDLIFFFYFCWLIAVFLKWPDSLAEFLVQCFDSPVCFMFGVFLITFFYKRC